LNTLRAESLIKKAKELLQKAVEDYTTEIETLDIVLDFLAERKTREVNLNNSYLYAKLKKLHIQQDTRTACSLASFLMVLNCIKNEHTSQTEFRRYLEVGRFDRWVSATGAKGGGLGVAQLIPEMRRVLRLNRLMWDIEKISSKAISHAGFQDLLHQANLGNFFLIFNYDSHYSPFGGMRDQNVGVILDVDAMRVYKDSGDTLPLGTGEVSFEPVKFLRKLQSKKRYIIKIAQNERIIYKT
jgi:hypothetical protein